MKPHNFISVSLFTLVLAACGNAQNSAPAQTATAAMPMDMSNGQMTVDNSEHDMSAMGDGFGHATGVIKSLGSEGTFVTLQHGPFEGIDMGAMTMGFDIMDDVDLSGFAEGDAVAFMVKQGRDGSFRVVSMCNTAKEGADCLESMMDH